MVYTLDSVPAARVRRDASGAPVPRAVITADGAALGPGPCTYDAASDTGVLLVSTDFALSAFAPRNHFSRRATGIHW